MKAQQPLIGAFLMFLTLWCETSGAQTISTSDTVCAGKMPQFPGGDSALFAHLNKYVDFKKYQSPEPLHDTVSLHFIVNADGTVTGGYVSQRKGKSKEYDQNLLEAVTAFPVWQPHTVNGNPILSNFTIIIRIDIDSANHGTFLIHDENTDFYCEAMPTFPGGDAAFSTYLSENIKYPPRERKKGIQGTVYVYFVVGKDGSISETRAVREVPDGPGLTREAIRVISGMPKWTPGFMNGRAVKVSLTVPIRFVL